LVADNGSRGIVGNSLSDGTTAAARWVRYGQWKGKVGENICYALESPYHVVQQWIIDDGNGNRTHRKYARLDWIGLDWIGSDWIGSDWMS